MQITEVKIFLKEGQDKKLKAYATLTFDNCFVVRNVKVIEGTRGLFIAMPSRKMKESCPKCHFKNAMRSRFCNQCGTGLPQTADRMPAQSDDMAKQSEHKDIAHPITAECRDYIQKKVIEAYESEKRSGQPAAETQSRPAPAAPAPDRGRIVPPPPPPQRPAMEGLEEDTDIEL